jgi:hypothetical protein
MVDEALAQLTRPASDESTGPLSVEAIAQLREDAASILEAENPLEAIKKELRRLGLGGDPKPGLVLYLAGTGRVLGKRKGAIQAHGQVIAEAGSGKSYLSDLVFSTYPARAVVRYSASSPKVLLRDTRPLQHRVILYSEMDSIPGAQSGDDEQAAASAIRELLQNDELIYHVVGKDDAGRSVVEVCRRAGPTALFTTTTRRASSRQFDSRLFALELDTTSQQLREALDAQADLELTDELPAPTPAVVAVQAYLQALAPLDVVIPYIRPLHALLQVSRVDVRILRDAARLRTLIKAATLLHIAQRERNAAGRLIATYDDYQLVIDLLADTYEHTVTGVTEKMRELVATVAANPGSSQTKLASLLQVSQSAIAQRVKVALERRWLADTAWPRGLGYAQQLQVGEPLPHPCGLPSVEQLKAWKPQAQRVAWGAR